MSKLFATGDKHGPLCMLEYGPGCFPAGKKLTTNDVVVTCGDTNTLFDPKPSKREKENIAYLASMPFTTALVDGNHDNILRFRALPQAEMFGDVVGVIAPNVVYLQRGHVYNINGNVCFTMGGAASVDARYRIENVSWWRDEIPTSKEMELGLKTLASYQNKVDFIFTHTCPRFVLDKLREHMALYPDVADPLLNYFSYIANNVKFKHWYYGHYHFPSTFYIYDKFYTCLFTQMVLVND